MSDAQREDNRRNLRFDQVQVDVLQQRQQLQCDWHHCEFQGFSSQFLVKETFSSFATETGLVKRWNVQRSKSFARLALAVTLALQLCRQTADQRRGTLTFAAPAWDISRTLLTARNTFSVA
jgi:hypothetical protein